MQISRQTRADEVVKMILSSYDSDEPHEKFVLVESLSDSEGTETCMCLLWCQPSSLIGYKIKRERALTNQSKHAVFFNQSGANKNESWPLTRVFPRLALVACFPVLGAGCKFLLRVLIGSFRYLRLL